MQRKAQQELQQEILIYASAYREKLEVIVRILSFPRSWKEAYVLDVLRKLGEAWTTNLRQVRIQGIETAEILGLSEATEQLKLYHILLRLLLPSKRVQRKADTKQSKQIINNRIGYKIGGRVCRVLSLMSHRFPTFSEGGQKSRYIERRQRIIASSQFLENENIGRAGEDNGELTEIYTCLQLISQVLCNIEERDLDFIVYQTEICRLLMNIVTKCVLYHHRMSSYILYILTYIYTCIYIKTYNEKKKKKKKKHNSPNGFAHCYARAVLFYFVLFCFVLFVVRLIVFHWFRVLIHILYIQRNGNTREKFLQLGGMDWIFKCLKHPLASIRVLALEYVATCCVDNYFSLKQVLFCFVLYYFALH
ncbi:hypothetical protein RFI_27688 [Reticulomyxa filosa]|uniref:Uncharacterized protein n=1 Tax=Reticulomyxa filosa TaxID=46433 RepID=X6M9J7_RETFI|nr:hypothetical protein RFI_27688 [Reticulomyxa filosa]|eukprot:ETO09690.1 hypothetical protein RFI_27688 [Reticulomyxa filosa]